MELQIPFMVAKQKQLHGIKQVPLAPIILRTHLMQALLGQTL